MDVCSPLLLLVLQAEYKRNASTNKSKQDLEQCRRDLLEARQKLEEATGQTLLMRRERDLALEKLRSEHVAWKTSEASYREKCSLAVSNNSANQQSLHGVKWQIDSLETKVKQVCLQLEFACLFCSHHACILYQITVC